MKIRQNYSLQSPLSPFDVCRSSHWDMRCQRNLNLAHVDMSLILPLITRWYFFLSWQSGLILWRMSSILVFPHPAITWIVSHTVPELSQSSANKLVYGHSVAQRLLTNSCFICCRAELIPASQAAALVGAPISQEFSQLGSCKVNLKFTNSFFLKRLNSKAGGIKWVGCRYICALLPAQEQLCCVMERIKTSGWAGELLSSWLGFAVSTHLVV